MNTDIIRERLRERVTEPELEDIDTSVDEDLWPEDYEDESDV